MTDKKCPKCKSKNFEIHDTYEITGEETWDYIVKDGFVIGNGSRIDYRFPQKSYMI